MPGAGGTRPPPPRFSLGAGGGPDSAGRGGSGPSSPGENEKGRQANLAALPLLLGLAYFTSTMLLSAFNEVPSANVAL